MKSEPSIPVARGVSQSPYAGDVEEILRRASAEIEQSNFTVAADLLMSASRLEPRSSELLNSAALSYLRAGNLVKAKDALQKAAQLCPDDKDVIHNLALTCWALGDHSETRSHLRKLTEIDPQNADAFNDLAVFEEEQGNVDAAITAYQEAISLSTATPKVFVNYFESCLKRSNYQALRAAITSYSVRWGSDAVLEEWRSKLTTPQTPQAKQSLTVSAGGDEHRVKGLKIAFFASFHSFLKPIMDHLREDNQVRLFEQGSEQEMQILLEWCDLAWFEWCDSLVIAATKMRKQCKIICRLHSYEVFTEMPRQVDWNNVDHLVLVNRSVKELLSLNTAVSTPTTIIHNGVDTDRFTIPAMKKYGKNICSIGYINYKKNPALLLYCFKAIHDYDRDYRFHIAGTHQDPRIQVYFEHLLPRLNIPVSFDGWVEDIPAYLRDKDYVISTSLFESFHYSIAEGMAAGVIPLIHDWMGAEYIYPSEFLFTTPAACVELVKTIEKQNRSKLGQECREFVRSRYDLKDQQLKINKLINEVVSTECGTTRHESSKHVN